MYAPRPRFSWWRTAAGAVVLLCAGSSIPAAAQGTRIGYIDMPRLIGSAPQVRSGRKSLELEFAERDALLKQQEVRLQGMEEALRRERGLLPAATLQSREQEALTLKRNIERTRERLRADLNARSKQELSKRWPEIHDAIIEFAREENYDLVVESPVLYASAAIDITDQVIERLKQKAAQSTLP